MTNFTLKARISTFRSKKAELQPTVSCMIEILPFLSFKTPKICNKNCVSANSKKQKNITFFNISRTVNDTLNFFNIVELCKFKARSGYNFIQIPNKYKKWHSKNKIKL